MLRPPWPTEARFPLQRRVSPLRHVLPQLRPPSATMPPWRCSAPPETQGPRAASWQAPGLLLDFGRENTHQLREFCDCLVQPRLLRSVRLARTQAAPPRR